MKTHAIIPIFIPHLGCPNDCVFCNQKKITAKLTAATEDEVRGRIESYLPTLQGRGLKTIEIAFFGGSFTGIPIEDQSRYLAIAAEYKRAGLVDKIHLSTRPDYIDREILDNLKAYDVDVIELGVQSFDDRVLALSNRGHNAEVVYKSSQLIKDYGFELGIQLMIGLPGDSLETCLYSARETVKIAPTLARLYPTIVIKDTELFDMYEQGTYSPLTVEEAALITKEMYKILDSAGINIMRVGLKSTDIINDSDGNENLAGRTYHPAFRQIVEGMIARESIEEQLAGLGILPDSADGTGADKIEADKALTFVSNPHCFSNMIGNCGVNKKYFAEAYPALRITYRQDKSLSDNMYIVREL